MKPASQQEIISLILAERRRQDAKWGAKRRLPPSTWHLILSEEVGEVAKECLEENDEAGDALRAELVQVAAVAVAWLEAMAEP